MFSLIGSVCILTNPAGASITIDGLLQTQITATSPGGMCDPIINTISGLASSTSHTLDIYLPGYVSISGRIFNVISGETTTIDLGNLVPLTSTGSVCIKSNPAGASIIIDGSSTGKTTASSGGTCDPVANIIKDLTPGVNVHSYKLDLSGYQSITGNLSINSGLLTTIDIGSLQPQVAQFGFGATGIVLIAGLAIGMLISKCKK